jgi:hypothetical protein
MASDPGGPMGGVCCGGSLTLMSFDAVAVSCLLESVPHVSVALTLSV